MARARSAASPYLSCSKCLRYILAGASFSCNRSSQFVTSTVGVVAAPKCRTRIDTTEARVMHLEANIASDIMYGKQNSSTTNRGKYFVSQFSRLLFLFATLLECGIFIIIINISQNKIKRTMPKRRLPLTCLSVLGNKKVWCSERDPPETDLSSFPSILSEVIYASELKDILAAFNTALENKRIEKIKAYIVLVENSAERKLFLMLQYPDVGPPPYPLEVGGAQLLPKGTPTNFVPTYPQTFNQKNAVKLLHAFEIKDENARKHKLAELLNIPLQESSSSDNEDYMDTKHTIANISSSSSSSFLSSSSSSSALAVEFVADWRPPHSSEARTWLEAIVDSAMDTVTKKKDGNDVLPWLNGNAPENIKFNSEKMDSRPLSLGIIAFASTGITGNDYAVHILPTPSAEKSLRSMIRRVLIMKIAGETGASGKVVQAWMYHSPYDLTLAVGSTIASKLGNSKGLKYICVAMYPRSISDENGVFTIPRFAGINARPIPAPMGRPQPSAPESVPRNQVIACVVALRKLWDVGIVLNWSPLYSTPMFSYLPSSNKSVVLDFAHADLTSSSIDYANQVGARSTVPEQQNMLAAFIPYLY